VTAAPLAALAVESMWSAGLRGSATSSKPRAGDILPLGDHAIVEGNAACAALQSTSWTVAEPLLSWPEPTSSNQDSGLSTL
jgi:hypothetical protein